MTTRLSLPELTLCAVDTRHPELALFALEQCMKHAHFARVLLFTASNWRPTTWPEGVEIVAADEVDSAAAYSTFMLKGLLPYVQTSHVLVVQWDGFIVHPQHWQKAFLDTDYIGAVWPQFKDGCRVGNGGFSLRSRRLLAILANDAFEPYHPEDVGICRVYHKVLVGQHAISFASEALAATFSVERLGNVNQALGFHGLANLVKVLDREGVKAMLNILPEDVFWSTEARPAIKHLIRLGWLDLAEYALAKRTMHASFSLGNLRLTLRLLTRRFWLGRFKRVG